MKNKSHEELQELVDKLSHDVNYDCWTRPGLELIAWPEICARARWIVFADLDYLHQFNDTYGHDEINRRITEAMQLRKTDVAASGRWYSGDELVWILCDDEGREPADPQRAAKRLQEAFKKVGLSATFGIARVLSLDLTENVIPAYQIVERAKKKDRRGTINQTGRLPWRRG